MILLPPHAPATGPTGHAEAPAHSVNLSRPLSASGSLRPFGCPNRLPAASDAVTSAPIGGAGQMKGGIMTEAPIAHSKKPPSHIAYFVRDGKEGHKVRRPEIDAAWAT